MLKDIISSNSPVLIAGPTASGKSRLAIEIARASNGCIINADALQIYSDWQVLTARPSTNETLQCPHQMYGHVGLLAPYSVGHWLRDIQATLTDVTSAGLRPIVVGGTGLYFRALTQGLTNIPPIPDTVRNAANELIAVQGLQVFAQILKESDPLTYEKIDILNPARTQRAWEVLEATGRGMADWQARTPPPLLGLDRVIALNLNSDKDWLNARINQRFDQMVNMGALDECRAVMENGWDPQLPSCQAIGAAELIAHLKGDMQLDAAIASAKIQTHQYAKRQRTWFRSKMKDWKQVQRADADWVFST